MKSNEEAKLLRVFIGEGDQLGHIPLYEAILFEARRMGLAGCTVMKGSMSFGSSTIVHTAKFIEVSQDLPIVIEIVDEEEKINRFVEVVDGMIDQSGGGGLITLEKVQVLLYRSRKARHR